MVSQHSISNLLVIIDTINSIPAQLGSLISNVLQTMIKESRPIAPRKKILSHNAHKRIPKLELHYLFVQRALQTQRERSYVVRK